MQFMVMTVCVCDQDPEEGVAEIPDECKPSGGALYTAGGAGSYMRMIHSSFLFCVNGLWGLGFAGVPGELDAASAVDNDACANTADGIGDARFAPVDVDLAVFLTRDGSKFSKGLKEEEIIISEVKERHDDYTAYFTPLFYGLVSVGAIPPDTTDDKLPLLGLDKASTAVPKAHKGAHLDDGVRGERRVRM